MEGFSLATFTSTSTSTLFVNATTPLPSILCSKRRARSVSLRRKQKLLVFASTQESEFDEWENLELKFGKMIDEDPQVTLAKIKARRLNPDATFSELEKSFSKDKGKPVDIEGIPLDWARPSREVSPPEHVQVESSVDGLNLFRPVPKKGVKFESSINAKALETRKPSLPVRKPVENVRRSVPNVILRKPTMSNEEDVGEKPSGLSFRPNLSLKISNAQSAERFSDMTLLRKPEPLDVDKLQELSGNTKAKVMDDIKLKMSGNENIDKSDITLLRKPKRAEVNIYRDKKQQLSDGAKAKAVDDTELKMLLRKPKPTGVNIHSFKKQELSGGAKAKAVDDIELKKLLRKPKPLVVNENVDKEQELSDGAKAKDVDDIVLKMLLRKPKPLVDENVDKKQERSGDAKAKVVDDIELKKSVNENNDKRDMRLLRKPEPMGVNEHRDKKQELPGGAKTKAVDDIELKMGEEEAKVKQSDFTLLKKPEAVWAPSNLDGKKEQFEDPEVQISYDVQLNGLRGSSKSSEMEDARTDEHERLLEAIHDLLSKKAKMGDIELKMGEEEAKVKRSDFTLLKKPEAVWGQSNLDGKKKQFEDPEVQVSDVQQNGLRGSFESSEMEDARTDEHERLVEAIDALLSKKAKMDDIELKMGEEEGKVKHSDFTLLNKPEAVCVQSNLDGKKEQFEDPEVQVSDDVQQNGLRGSSECSEMEDATNEFERLGEDIDGLLSNQAKMDDDYDIGQQQLVQGDMGSTEEEIVPSELSATSSVNSNSSMKFAATLQGKPQRLDQPVRKTSKPAIADTVFSYPAESYRSGGSIELESSRKASPSKNLEDTYWRLAEEMLNMRKWEKVELIIASSRGFVASLGPLVGFLPYTQLPAKKKFFAFETWLRTKGLDPSLYWDKLEIIRSYGITNTNLSPEVDQKIEGGISPDMQLEDLLKIYEQEKIKFMSSFVGQTPTVCVLMADRGSQKLIFSLIPWKDEGIIEKKRSLMAKLQIGDVVTCRITRIAYFGVFVEVEGVPAMIHQTEVSWDATLDPSSYFKIGQILDAKVHQLNFELERIFLSLKDITPDPLSEALESVIGDHNPLDGRLQATEADTEWADVESLVRELQQIEGVQSVSKGQFFLSPGFAPTFQVYMAIMFADQYRLLARSGNKVQEVIVQSSLDKEVMKAAVLKCTS